MSMLFLFLERLDPYTTNYYVDSVGGNDLNSGTMASPWQTLARVQTIAGSLNPWTAIYLKCDSVWTGTDAFLNIDVSNIKIAAYGVGALPKIDGRVTLSSGGWTPYLATSHTYKHSFTGLVGTAEQHNIWEDGVRLTRAASIAEVDTTPGSYWVPAEAGFTTGVAVDFYVNPTTNDNPATNGKVYTTQGTVWSIQIGSTTSTNCRVYNVEVMGGCHHNGNIVLGRNSYAEGIISRWGTIHSIYTDSGFFVNCTSYDCEQGFDFVANKGSAFDGFIEMNGCVADVDETSGIIAGPGYFVHGDTFTTIRYINCISREHAIGFGINGCPDGQEILIDGCEVYSSAITAAQPFHAYDLNNGDVSPNNSTTITISDCLADGPGFYLYGLGWNTHTTFSVIKGRFIQRMAQACVQFRGATGEISYCSFYAPSHGGYSGLELDTTNATINWHHNIVDGCGLGTEQFNAPTYTATNNVWHDSGGSNSPVMRVAGTLYGSFAAYASANEVSSSNADPLWVEAPNISYNFALQSGSPADTLTAGYSHAP